MRYVLAAVAALCILVLGAPAAGQEHQHPPRDAQLHDKFYSTWNMPNGGQPRTSSCCSSKDCYPTTIKNVGGVWFAQRREDQAWIMVPDAKVEQNQSDPRESPDGLSHVCMAAPTGGANVYCAVLGTGQ